MRDGWVETTLGEIAEVNPEATNGFDSDRPIRYVDLSSVSAISGIDLEAVSTYRFGEAPGRARRVIRADDVLVATVRPYLRGFARVPAEFDGEVASTGFVVLRAREGVALPGFVWAVVQTHAFVDGLMARATGSNYPAVRPSDVAQQPVLLPPFPEQRRIVDLITSVDGATRGRAIRDAVSRTIEAIVGRISTEAAEPTPLSSVVNHAKAGGTPSRRERANFVGAIPWLKSGEVEADMISTTGEAISETALQRSSAWLMPAGTIVIAMYGATAGEVGFTAVPMSCNQAVLGLVPDASRVDPRFLFHWLRSRKELMRSRRAGSSQPNLSKELVLEETVPALSLDRQREIARALDALLALAHAAQQYDDQLTLLRAALTHALLSGEHGIPGSYDALLEEPAVA